MSFIETPRFPDLIALGSAGGPEYRTEITELNSGLEQRNQVWAYPRHRYDIGVGANTSAKMDTVRDWFHSMRGRLHGFRFKDFNDFSSAPNMNVAITNTDQLLGVGNGVITTFQIVKLYTTGSLIQTRKITKPVAGSVLVAVAGTPQTLGVNYTLDTTTGIITFLPTLPTGNVTAGFQFDVPVRFDSDLVQFEHLTPGIQRASIGIVEIKS